MNYTNTSYPHYAQWDYTFERTIRRNGRNTRWFQTLKTIANAPEGELTKREILRRVYDAKNISNGSHPEEMNINGVNCKVRGYSSHMFGCMRGAGLIDYDSRTRGWSITIKGKFMAMVGDQL